jgi:hypothetical protein
MPEADLASGLNRVRALQFDHLVGAGQKRGWNGEPERLCGLEVDYQIET